MKPLFWYAIWSAIGVTLIAIPDSGPRLITFSDAHGPGLLDGIGVLCLLLGSSGLWLHIWRRRTAITQAAPRVRTLWTFTAGLGTGLVLASVVSDFAAWWAVGAGLLTLVQFGLYTQGAFLGSNGAATDQDSGLGSCTHT